MKQYITNADFLQLSEESQDRFNEWAKDKAFGKEITTGILIEFLDDETSWHIVIEKLPKSKLWFIIDTTSRDSFQTTSEELCDALWKAVKYCLDLKESHDPR